MPKKITIPDTELWDSKNEKFIYKKGQTIILEHSLVSISKWEAKWHKPFLSKEKMTTEEVLSYIECMTLTQNVDPEIYKYLSSQNVDDVLEYIEDTMTATWFGKNEDKTPVTKRAITSEIIYYWMFSLGIPIECQKWHLNRLLTLIKVFNEENKPKKKMSQKSLFKRNSELNAARKAMLNSKG